MMRRPTSRPEERRIAFFTDSFHETNGVGTLSREYLSYARASGIPFFCAYGGTETKLTRDESVEELQLRRGPLSFAVDADVMCDPALVRHRDFTVDNLKAFRPDLVHITGPGDVSVLGMWAAKLVGVPVVASWHTNLHDYAARRLESLFRPVMCGPLHRLCAQAREGAMRALTKYYRVAHFIAAPNEDSVDLLARATQRPSFLMAHGVNTALFNPERRRPPDDAFRIGYVGRLSPEKSVRALVDLERSLLASGERDFRIVVVGDGSEREWLRGHLTQADFLGVLRGEALAEAFANFDAFVFPSVTDTFGLVILEAMASGVPVLMTPEAGERAGVQDGVDGVLARDHAPGVRRLMHCRQTRRLMGAAARDHACERAWRGVFDHLQGLYAEGLAHAETLRRMPVRRF